MAVKIFPAKGAFFNPQREKSGVKKTRWCTRGTFAPSVAFLGFRMKKKRLCLSKIRHSGLACKGVVGENNSKAFCLAE
ncbi:hypothetical protein, partial [Salmonella enterica]|uniref:hypothetical protein n=1 Tax=Salmonella enterica TaxID=28901 RepID=UPI001A7E64A5